jgi:SAM-dependent methyltransferase
MPPSFAEIAPRYDALRPLSVGDRARLQKMLQSEKLTPDDLVVEVGCGTGRMTLPIAASTAARVMGVEPEQRMLEVARSKDLDERVSWRSGTAYRLPLADGSASLVAMILVVHLLRQRVRAFKEARRVLRSDGRFCLWTFTPGHIEGFYLNEYFPSIPVIDLPRFPPVEVVCADLRRAGFSRLEVDIVSEARKLDIAEVVDRVRGRYISTLSMLPPLEYRLGLQRLEEMLAQDRSITMSQRTEWAIVTATTPG